MKKFFALTFFLLACFIIFPQSTESGTEDNGFGKMPLTLESFIESAKSINMLQIRLGMSYFKNSGGAAGVFASSKEERDENFYKYQDALIVYMDSYLELLLYYKQSDFRNFRSVSQNALTKTLAIKQTKTDTEVIDNLETVLQFYRDLIGFANSKI